MRIARHFNRMEIVVKVQIILTGLISIFVAPSLAPAQSLDVKYCAALSDSYNQYVLSSEGGRNNRSAPANIAAAMAKCSSDPTSAIPILEKVLTDQKVPLPSRN
jgi:hypothetical protein